MSRYFVLLAVIVLLLLSLSGCEEEVTSFTLMIGSLVYGKAEIMLKPCYSFILMERGLQGALMVHGRRTTTSLPFTQNDAAGIVTTYEYSFVNDNDMLKLKDTKSGETFVYTKY